MENKNPIYSIALLPVSGKKRIGVIDLKAGRTLVVSIRGTYDASATLPLRCNLYYTPNNKNWDTIPYTYFDVAVTQSAACQKTAIIDPAEYGLMAIEIENRDASYTITDISIWSNLEIWPEVKK